MTLLTMKINFESPQTRGCSITVLKPLEAAKHSNIPEAQPAQQSSAAAAPSTELHRCISPDLTSSTDQKHSAEGRGTSALTPTTINSAAPLHKVHVCSPQLEQTKQSSQITNGIRDPSAARVRSAQQSEHTRACERTATGGAGAPRAQQGRQHSPAAEAVRREQREPELRSS